MTIRRLLTEVSLKPEDAAALTAAYDDCIGRLMLRDRDDKITELVARTIIEAAKSGERNPDELCTKALTAIGHLRH